MKKLGKYILAILLCITGVLGISGCGEKVPDNIYNNYTVTESEAMTLIAEQSLPAVVTFMVINSAGNGSIGSGVCIAKGSYIATNYHVISSVVEFPSQYKIYISHNGDYGSAAEHTGKLLWYNVETDLAIVKCSCTDCKVLEMEDRTVNPAKDRKLRIVEDVIAIGTPLDPSLQNTVTKGNISQFNRIATAQIDTTKVNIYESLIQHTAAISGGNSGGPLIDVTGKVIGLNTLSLADTHTVTNAGQIESTDANSLYFATPILPIIKVIDKVKAAYEAGQSSFSAGKTGLTYYDRYKENGGINTAGLYVSKVDIGSAADGKIPTNAIITGVEVNGTSTKVNIRNDFLYATIGCAAGETITIKYITSMSNENSVSITLK